MNQECDKAYYIFAAIAYWAQLCPQYLPSLCYIGLKYHEHGRDLNLQQPPAFVAVHTGL